MSVDLQDETLSSQERQVRVDGRSWVHRADADSWWLRFRALRCRRVNEVAGCQRKHFLFHNSAPSQAYTPEKGRKLSPSFLYPVPQEVTAVK